jgi:hypothetical protein
VGRIANIPLTLGEPAIILWLLIRGAKSQPFSDSERVVRAWAMTSDWPTLGSNSLADTSAKILKVKGVEFATELKTEVFLPCFR